MTTATLDFETLPATELRCPLDNNPVDNEQLSDFYVCSKCSEMLYPAELVSRATAETWAGYLLCGVTETEPRDAPLSRLA